MFTGLIESTGSVRDRSEKPEGLSIKIDAPYTSYELGESIAVDGVCLTVAEFSDTWFRAELSAETLERTTLGQLQVGNRVHLERALKLGDRLGGHFVSGHVDAVVEVTRVVTVGECLELAIRVPQEWFRFTAEKGSIALNGVSLTINRAVDHEVQLMLVPHTLEKTTFRENTVGAKLNLEVDMVARYVCHWMDTAPEVEAPKSQNARLLDLLVRQGYA